MEHEESSVGGRLGFLAGRPLRSLFDMCVFDWMLLISEKVGNFHSIEFPGKRASKSEMRRWLKSQSVHINGKAVHGYEEIPVINNSLIKSLKSFVLFPKGKRKITII